MSNCSDLPNSFGLKSYSWLGISTVERGNDKKCYYKKEDVDKKTLKRLTPILKRRFCL